MTSTKSKRVLLTFMLVLTILPCASAKDNIQDSIVTNARMASLDDTLTACHAASAKEQNIQQQSSISFQLRSNALYTMALCPNIGIELQTGNGLAWQLDYIGAWWNNDRRHRYYSCYALQTEMRYYLAGKEKDAPHSGHHAGVYFQMATYDFEFGGTGYQCKDLDKSLGFGISYGYSKPISRRLSLDFTLGIGYFTSKYTVYEPSGDWYKPTGYKKLTWFGPTKAEVTLVWNLNKNNNR